ncbi:MAG: hypothetical protein L0229_00445 [Blastocatellia bacterium]|nr:hypothetical protein [Blastocatellia bacterium]
MRQQAITVELPEDVYERLKRAARGMNGTVEQALASIVKAAMPSLETMPPRYRSELEDMESLSDDGLREVAESRISAAKQWQLDRLSMKNQMGELTPEEQRALTRLRDETDRLMLRRSYAYMLLKCRGHRIPVLNH